MSSIIALSRLLAVVAIAITAAGSATAKDLIHPEKSDIAFVLHFPDELATSDDGKGNLIVTAPDRSWALSLGTPIEIDASVDDVAKEVLAAAKAQPYSSHGPAMLGGHKAEAYRS